MDDNKSAALEAIRTKGALDADTEQAIKEALTQLTSKFVPAN